MDRKRLGARIGRFVLFVLLLLTLAFAWGASGQDSMESSRLSEAVRLFLERLLHISIDPFLLRKAAHFSEYGLLGAEIAGILRLTGGKGALGALSGRNLLDMPLLGLAAAAVDETIQVFSWRGSSLIDVWIDTAGFATGFFGMALVLALCRAAWRALRRGRADAEGKERI